MNPRSDNESGQHSDASEKHDDRSSLRLFLKGAFGFQPVKKNSMDASTSTAVLKKPCKNHAMFVAGFRTKPDDHRDLASTWNGTFSKKV
jgi:hypothetical protein